MKRWGCDFIPAGCHPPPPATLSGPLPATSGHGPPKVPTGQCTTAPVLHRSNQQRGSHGRFNCFWVARGRYACPFRQDGSPGHSTAHSHAPAHPAGPSNQRRGRIHHKHHAPPPTAPQPRHRENALLINGLIRRCACRTLGRSAVRQLN